MQCAFRETMILNSFEKSISQSTAPFMENNVDETTLIVDEFNNDSWTQTWGDALF